MKASRKPAHAQQRSKLPVRRRLHGGKGAALGRDRPLPSRKSPFHLVDPNAVAAGLLGASQYPEYPPVNGFGAGSVALANLLSLVAPRLRSMPEQREENNQRQRNAEQPEENAFAHRHGGMLLILRAA